MGFSKELVHNIKSAHSFLVTSIKSESLSIMDLEEMDEYIGDFEECVNNVHEVWERRKIELCQPTK
jgi:hypothetical protein